MNMNSIDISAPGITDLKYTKHKNILVDIQKKTISRMTDKILISDHNTFKTLTIRSQNDQIRIADSIVVENCNMKIISGYAT